MGRKPNSGMQTKQEPTRFDHCDGIIEDMAQELISKYHPHLVNKTIAYLFCNKDMKRKGKMTIATAEKCSKKVYALCSCDFVITISYPLWNNLSDKQKWAALDHELCHCFVDDDEKTGDEKLSLLPHDFEEFGAVIQRHGLVFADLEQLGRVVRDVGSSTMSVTESTNAQPDDTNLLED